MGRVLFLYCMISWVVFGGVNAVYAETTAVIANHGDDEILRIFTDDEDLDTISVSGHPYGVAVTPDGVQALVTLEDENQLAFVNMNDFFETPLLLSVGESPRGVAVDPTGVFAYVGNFEDDTVSEIRMSGQTVIGTYEVGDGPMGVVALYDEEEESPVIYIANHLEDSISVIDDEKKMTLITVGDGPTGLAISPDEKYLYAAVMNDNKLSIIDTADNEIVDTVSVGEDPWGVAVGGKGDYVYVTNRGDDTVTVVSAADFSVVRTFSVGSTPSGVAAPRNGNFAYVVSHVEGAINKIDMDDNTVTEIAEDTLTDAFCLGSFIGGAPPNAPSSLALETEKGNSIDLSWSDNSDDEDGFKIERSKEDEERYTQIAIVKPDTTTYQDRGLDSETVYFYRIRSYNEAADSDFGTSTSLETLPYSGSVWCFIHTMVDDQ